MPFLECCLHNAPQTFYEARFAYFSQEAFRNNLLRSAGGEDIHHIFFHSPPCVPRRFMSSNFSPQFDRVLSLTVLAVFRDFVIFLSKVLVILCLGYESVDLVDYR